MMDTRVQSGSPIAIPHCITSFLYSTLICWYCSSGPVESCCYSCQQTLADVVSILYTGICLRGNFFADVHECKKYNRKKSQCLYCAYSDEFLRKSFWWSFLAFSRISSSASKSQHFIFAPQSIIALPSDTPVTGTRQVHSIRGYWHHCCRVSASWG